MKWLILVIFIMTVNASFADTSANNTSAPQAPSDAVNRAETQQMINQLFYHDAAFQNFKQYPVRKLFKIVERNDDD